MALFLSELCLFAKLLAAARFRVKSLGFTHRPLSSSFLGLPYRILNINHKKELPRGLRVGC